MNTDLVSRELLPGLGSSVRRNEPFTQYVVFTCLHTEKRSIVPESERILVFHIFLNVDGNSNCFALLIGLAENRY